MGCWTEEQLFHVCKNLRFTATMFLLHGLNSISPRVYIKAQNLRTIVAVNWSFCTYGTLTLWSSIPTFLDGRATVLRLDLYVHIGQHIPWLRVGVNQQKERSGHWLWTKQAVLLTWKYPPGQSPPCVWPTIR